MRANKLRRYYQWRTSRHVMVPYNGLLADKPRLLQQIAAMKVGVGVGGAGWAGWGWLHVAALAQGCGAQWTDSHCQLAIADGIMPQLQQPDSMCTTVGGASVAANSRCAAGACFQITLVLLFCRRMAPAGGAWRWTAPCPQGCAASVG
jgi:hypothetical protein